MVTVIPEQLALAAAALPFEYDPPRNLERCLQVMSDAAERGADVVLLPEQILQGYLPSIVRFDEAAVEYQHAHAEAVPGGPSVRRLAAHARQLRMHAMVGLTERAEDEGPAVLYNTAVILGWNGYVGKYRKVHQPGCEGAVYWPGREIEPIDLPIGRTGTLICYDKWFVEPVRELALMRADLVFIMSACCLERPGSPPEGDYAVDTYRLLDRARAFENQLWLVTSNVVGRCGDEEYFGQARIVSPEGHVVAETPCRQEGLAIATVEAHAGIVRARARNAVIGLDMLRHRRPASYRHLCS